MGSNTHHDGMIGNITGKDTAGYLIRTEAGKSILMEAKYLKEIKNTDAPHLKGEATKEHRGKDILEQIGKDDKDGGRRSKSTRSSGGQREGLKSVDEREKHVFTSI